MSLWLSTHVAPIDRFVLRLRRISDHDVFGITFCAAHVQHACFLNSSSTSSLLTTTTFVYLATATYSVWLFSFHDNSGANKEKGKNFAYLCGTKRNTQRSHTVRSTELAKGQRNIRLMIMNICISFCLDQLPLQLPCPNSLVLHITECLALTIIYLRYTV